MQTLEVTDEQYAFIQHLRGEISEQVVGKYGHVRERDAVQFLIDTFDDELEIDGAFEPSESGAFDVETAADDEEIDDGEEVRYEEGDDSVDDTGTDDSTVDDAAPDDEPETDDESTADDGVADDDGAASDDDMLDRMMNLLETHDDKWEESPSADYRYRVELPDGTTDDVQTKDDVRALLFKHY